MNSMILKLLKSSLHIEIIQQTFELQFRHAVELGNPVLLREAGRFAIEEISMNLEQTTFDLGGHQHYTSVFHEEAGLPRTRR